MTSNSKTKSASLFLFYHNSHTVHFHLNSFTVSHAIKSYQSIYTSKVKINSLSAYTACAAELCSVHSCSHMHSDMFKNPLLWKFLDFASSTVGLLCYALSSSFQHLYGEWNTFKIILYVVVSLTITCIILFPKKLKVSRISGLEAHVVFLILMLTSWYSVFYNNKVNREPNALSIISNAAALMSLSLSRQIDFGFECGMSNFFLGCLTRQLMKINLVLTSAAAAFCYLVIIVRSLLDSQAQPEIGPVSDNDHVKVEIDTLSRVAASEADPLESGNLSSIPSSPRIVSDYDTRTAGRPVHRTLPGLISEITSEGRRMTYEEPCNAVQPHWHNLRKFTGERYGYSSHSEAVLDCLRNRHDWQRLV